ncbi:MAG: FAD/NAD(P)-binding oxidoreductase [FCB group bacterium]|jgi:NADPH-dependent 2,4-dienoyl-CoA reductase/sulfur reductase-like enzyme|nr:FAD/NAD(P)-binding oxidoreductase [FCB group bacterium]
MREYEYIILGGGVAGGYAVKEFVDRGVAPGKLALVSADERLPYERPPLSKGFLTGKKKEKDILISNEAFYAKRGIDAHLHTHIWRIDFYRRILYPKAGEEFSFRKLLLATGSRVRTLDVPGGDLENVFYLRSFDEALQIREAALGGGPAVVIGGGYIGLEVSAHLAELGIDTTLVVDGDTLLRRLFTPEMSQFFARYLRERGVQFLFNSHVTELTGAETVEAVVHGTGEPLPAGFVVAGIGVEPVVDLYRSAGLLAGDGVGVNEYLETKAPDVFAAGDIAVFPDSLDGHPRRLDHWDNAMQQGRHAARNMLEQKTPYEHIPYFFSDVFDLSWEFWGETDGADRIVYRGDVEGGSFSAWWLSRDRLLGAFVLNRPEAERELAPRWIRERKEFSPGELEGNDAFSTIETHSD